MEWWSAHQAQVGLIGMALLTAGIVCAWPQWRAEHAFAALLYRWFPRFRPPPPSGRPIAEIAEDARRLGGRFHASQRGRSYAKQCAVRRAYDDVLGEACAALRIVHLLAVLPAGVELDRERDRVEDALADTGLELREHA